MYLTPYDLTPTYRNIHNKFSVRYSLNLVLVDQVRICLAFFIFPLDTVE